MINSGRFGRVRAAGHRTPIDRIVPRCGAAIRVLVTLACALACAGARADDATRVGVALSGGLSGIGADLGVNVNSYFGVRGMVAGYSVKRNGNYGTNVSWNASLGLFQAGLLLDVYPFAGRFHLSGGIVHDGNKLDLTARPIGGTYTFNGNTYNTADIASASANVSWNRAVPYLGVGWGNLTGSPGLHFSTDLGALFTGTPNSTVSVTCSPVGQQAGVCQQLATDVAAEQARLQKKARDVAYWPILRFGVGYAF